MKPPRMALLCAAAGFAGWGGMALWRGMDSRLAAKPTAHSPAAGATPAGEFARPAGKAANTGSPGTAAALALAQSLDPANEASLSKLHALPPGTARDLALALFQSRSRRAPGDGMDPVDSMAFNPFGELPADAKLPPGGMEELARRLLAGESPDEFPESPADGTVQVNSPTDPFTAPAILSVGEISRWAGLDPAAASETILKMPAGQSRTAAVDAAAGVIARDNPQAAWDLVLKSGEQKLGEGAARAWMARIGQQDEFIKNPSAGLSPAQQHRMAAALVALLDMPNGESASALSGAELWPVACGASVLAPGPAQEKLLAAVAGRTPLALFFATGGGNGFLPEVPAHALFAAHGLLQRAQANPLEVVGAITKPDDSPHVHPAVLNAAAPRLLPQLARSGHLAEAVQLLPRITAPEAQRTALESILPQWMDADPAAARAAFNAAPFTALERERWQRHPAFLLNPERNP